jgi:hypothetical protein
MPAACQVKRSLEKRKKQIELGLVPVWTKAEVQMSCQSLVGQLGLRLATV